MESSVLLQVRNCSDQRGRWVEFESELTHGRPMYRISPMTKPVNFPALRLQRLIKSIDSLLMILRDSNNAAPPSLIHVSKSDGSKEVCITHLEAWSQRLELIGEIECVLNPDRHQFGNQNRLSVCVFAEEWIDRVGFRSALRDIFEALDELIRLHGLQQLPETGELPLPIYPCLENHGCERWFREFDMNTGEVTTFQVKEGPSYDATLDPPPVPWWVADKLERSLVRLRGTMEFGIATTSELPNKTTAEANATTHVQSRHDGSTDANNNGKKKLRIPKDEANILVREYLEHSIADPFSITREMVAAATGVSTGGVSNTNAWKAFDEERKRLKPARSREVQVNDMNMFANIPNNTVSSVELEQLIKEQEDDTENDKRNQNRRHRSS